MKIEGASWNTRAYYRVSRACLFSRASNYKVAGLCGVFSDASCFMQVVTGIKENIMQRLNKWKKAFFREWPYLCFIPICKQKREPQEVGLLQF